MVYVCILGAFDRGLHFVLLQANILESLVNAEAGVAALVILCPPSPNKVSRRLLRLSRNEHASLCQEIV